MTFHVSVGAALGGPGWSRCVRALLLDLDGTLVDSTAAVIEGWRRGAALLGVPFRDLEPYLHGIPADQVLRRVAPLLAADERRRVADEVLRAQADPHAPVALMPGAAVLLAALGDGPWAVVTSGDVRLATSSMGKAGIPPPPVLITADDVRRGKPDPEPYLRAAAALGVGPADCLVVEDSPAGVRAGLDAGMPVLALATTHPADVLVAAHQVARDLDDVRCRRSGVAIR
ncbi:MAG TPA: HAD-IA family hydrolase [Kineosporiaceae bacterium]